MAFTVNDAEIFIGIVGKIGTNTKMMISLINKQMTALGYSSFHIKLTNHIQNTQFKKIIDNSTTSQKYKTYIEACNKIRLEADNNSIFANIAVEKIRLKRREQSKTNDPNSPLARHAYIIDQIKRPEESEKLKEVYGDQFILVSCHIDQKSAIDNLAARIAEDNANLPRREKWISHAADLVDQDQMEEDIDHGQRVRQVFPLADVIIDSNDDQKSEIIIKRFFEALFGNFAISPTKDEFFQNIAYNVSLTSCDTARQVGAAIEVDGEIVSTGFNEAPKFGGGTYWADDGLDARDVTLGKDINTIRKRQMVIEIVEKLKAREFLADAINSLEVSELEGKLIDDKDAPLKETYVMDSLEYGRSVHAEMAALSVASRLGLSVGGGIVHCTTFPCHNCAKHIVASGIKKVVFIQSFPKSFVSDLYPDSISIDENNRAEERVVFRQFLGITPLRYRSLFEKSKSKDSRGYVREWTASKSSPIINKKVQDHFDSEIIVQKEIQQTLNKKQIKAIGILSE